MAQQGQQAHQPAGAQAQGVAIPLNVWSAHFDQLRMELRTKNVLDSIRKFDGEGQQKFTDWLRDMEKARVTTQGDDPQMKRLAALTLVGPASEFVLRTVREDPLITWADLKKALRERYSNLADEQFARQVLKRLRQGASEGLQNFAERIYIAAEEAFVGQDLTSAVIQQNLVEVFVDGLISGHIARKLIKTKPATLTDAVKVASGEDLATKAYNLRRGEVPMEVDVMGAGASTSTAMSTLINSVSQLTEQVGKLTKMVTTTNKGKGGGRGRAPTFKYTGTGDPICAKCDQPGHIRRDCPKKDSPSKNE